MKTHRSIINIAFNIYLVLLLISKSLSILGLATLAVSVFQGCSKQACSQDSNFTEATPIVSVKSAVHYSSESPINTIDALVFNNDIIQKIDCYQRFEHITEDVINIGSCGGPKIIFLCANSIWNKDEWRIAESFHKTNQMRVNLEEEDRSHPIMCAEIHTDAGASNMEANFERLSCMVGIRSISCDFEGKPYDGEKVTDARAYLINVNGSSSIRPQSSDHIERIINHRGLINDDIKAFKDSTLIISHIGTISPTASYPDIELTCYPNTCTQENAITQFTRLVIEGKILGERWFWPIDINRDQYGKGGLERNMKYSYDVVITRKGTKDPNKPITSEMAVIAFEAEKWTEKEEYQVAF